MHADVHSLLITVTVILQDTFARADGHDLAVSLPYETKVVLRNCTARRTWISIAYTSTSCVPLLGSSLPSSFWQDLRAQAQHHTLWYANMLIH